MKMKKAKTSDGNIKYEVTIGETVLSCYSTGKNRKNNTYSVTGRGKLGHLCTVKEEELEGTFEKCELIYANNGDFIKFLRSLKQRIHRPALISDDGEVKCYYHVDNEQNKYQPKCTDHGVKGNLSSLVDTEEEAMEIIQNVIDEYNEKGKFLRLLDKTSRSELPSAYTRGDKEAKYSNLDTLFHDKKSKYDSIKQYIKSYFDEKGKPLFNNNEALVLCYNDNTTHSVEKKHNLRFNYNDSLIIIKSDEDREIVIKSSLVNKVILAKKHKNKTSSNNRCLNTLVKK